MFRCQFGDFQQQYGIRNVIEGCFFHYPTENVRAEFLQCLVQHWVKEYRPSQVMKDLLAVVNHRDYFILTSNADTHLELSGFDAERIFEIEGTFENIVMNIPVQDKSRVANAFLDRYHGKRLVDIRTGYRQTEPHDKTSAYAVSSRRASRHLYHAEPCLELYIPDAIAHKSIGLEGDIAVTLGELKRLLP